MVEKMTKYSFILLSGETEGFLKWLQELGVLDIKRSVKPIDEQSSELFEKVSNVNKTIGILEKTDYTKDSDYTKIQHESTKVSIEGCKSKNTLEAVAQLENLTTNLSIAEKLKAEILPWGEYSKEKLEALSQKGLKIRFYKTSANKYDSAWEAEYAAVKINEDKNNVWFVTVSSDLDTYDFPIAECSAPALTLKEADEKIDSIKAEIIATKAKLLHLKENYLEHIKQGYIRKSADLDRYLANETTTEAAEGYINTITAFAPSEKDEILKQELDKNGVLYIANSATAEDNPPIKLKNNWFAKQFEVLTGMYGMPNYGEFDPTPILAPFFLLFFAMCMGDAGYGILLIAIGLFMRFKMAESGLGKMHRLVTFLGIGTLVIGVFLGTFFGINMLDANWTPAFIKNLCIDGWFPEGKIAGFPAQMVFAIVIGVFHICLAMVVKTIGYTLRFGFKNSISTWGWTLLIVGGIILAVLGTVDILGGAVLKWSVIALAVISALAIYIFNKPGRNPLINIGSGLWDTYNTVTGLLGDVLSYIRLYALGLAGGMLGNAFNLMGGMILDIPVPGINWIFCIVILIFGHVLNLAMSALGAFVHPLRLTFVEYFKNSGYEGNGKIYNPLSKDKTN